MIETQAQRDAWERSHQSQREALLQALQDRKQAEHGRNVLKHLRAIKAAPSKPKRDQSNRSLMRHPQNRNRDTVGDDPSTKSRAQEGGVEKRVGVGVDDVEVRESRRGMKSVDSYSERIRLGRERQRKYRARKRDEVNARNREWMRRVRAEAKARRLLGK